MRRITIGILLLSLISFCGYEKQTIDSSIQDTQIDIQELPADINSAFNKYNPLCEDKNSYIWKDACLSKICGARAEYNLEVVACKVGRLGYDYEYCSKLKDRFSEKIQQIEKECLILQLRLK